MPKHNHGRTNVSQFSFGRRHRAKRSHAILEALEKRRLLSGYTGQTFNLTNNLQGMNATQDGTYLQNILYGTQLLSNSNVTNHTLTLGDTLILPDGDDFDTSLVGGNDDALHLPNLGAYATATESGGTVSALTLGNIDVGGYTAQPTVSIFGGGGSGATATVAYDSANGTITGITLGNPGTGYTAAPTVAILGGAETLTIESSGYASITGRFNPATDLPYTARISSTGIDAIVETPLDISAQSAQWAKGAAQNYTFDGIEFCPDSDTQIVQTGILSIGLGGAASAQTYTQQVPSNFTFDDDYIHGGSPGETSDDLTNAGLATGWVDTGLAMNGNYITLENSDISDIHSAGSETHGIGGVNGLGNYTINNNFIEASGEGIIFGGAEITLPEPDEMTNVTITNNLITKNVAWDPNAPQFAGVAQQAKNDVEFKIGQYITISNNLLENSWIGADQRGEAINLSNIAYLNNPWSQLANVTVTDNVIRDCEVVAEISGGTGDTQVTGEGTGYYPEENAHDITFSNNLAYDIGGAEWGPNTGTYAIGIISNVVPITNLTIDNNTILGGDSFMSLTATSTNTAMAANFVLTNNVYEEGQYGIKLGGGGSDSAALNSYTFEGLIVTNAGSNYTSAPTVTISGGDGSGATATAYMWPQTEVGEVCPLYGQIMYIQITSPGSGYTAVPTISISGGGGSGGAATAMAPVNKQLWGYDFNGNVDIGGKSSDFPTGTTNVAAVSMNAVQMLDTPGDEYGIPLTSPFYTSGTSGSVPGVNQANITSPDFTPLDSSAGLVGVWQFDNGSGTTTTATTLSGTNYLGNIGSAVSWDSSGVENDALTFPGGTNTNTGCVNLTTQPAVPTNVSLMAGINPQNNAGNVSGIIGDGAAEFNLWIDGSGHLNAEVANTTVTDSSFDYYTHADQWYQVGCVFNSTTHTLTLYRNGQATASGSDTATIASGGQTFRIGNAAGGNFDGSIDDVYMYNTPLVGAEQVTGSNYIAGGHGYTNGGGSFAVSFSGGGGSGAAATAYAENAVGEVTSVIITNYGSGYTAAPTMSFTNGGGTGALDTAYMSGSQVSYLYQQYGPQIQGTMASENGNTITSGTSTTFLSNAITPEGTNVTYAWSCLVYPQTGIGAPTSANWNVADPTVDFGGPGHYLFQLQVTNAIGLSATYDDRVVVDPRSNTNVVFVSPANENLAPLGTMTASVNGTAIGSLSGLVDQFGVSMPSSGWSWAINGTPGTNNNQSGTITSPAGLYTAPNDTNLPTTLPNVVKLNYTTGDGVNYGEAYDTVIVTNGGPPAAPTNLVVAPPGTSTIAMTWTDPSNTSNVTGYHIWRSTDNSTWGSSAYATVTGATNSSYTDTSPSSGQIYYYEITSYNSSGDSTSAAGMTCGVATVTAYEGFNYPTTSSWTGGNTGVGFTANWNSGGTDTAIVTGLSYSVGSNALTTSGNAVQLEYAASIHNTLAQSVGATGTTLWAGFEFRIGGSGAEANVDIGTTSPYSTNGSFVSIGAGAFNDGGEVISDHAWYNNNAGNWNKSSTTTAAYNTTYFVVCSIEYLTTGDVLTLYVDPTPGVTPALTAGFTQTLPSSAQLPETSLVTLAPGQTGADTATFDELRLGTSYYSVAPDPLVGGGASASSKKSKPKHPFLVSTTSANNDSSDVVTKIADPGACRFYPYGGAWQFSNVDPSSLLLELSTGNDAWVGLFN